MSTWRRWRFALPRLRVTRPTDPTVRPIKTYSKTVERVFPLARVRIPASLVHASFVDGSAAAGSRERQVNSSLGRRVRFYRANGASSGASWKIAARTLVASALRP